MKSLYDDGRITGPSSLKIQYLFSFEKKKKIFNGILPGKVPVKDFTDIIGSPRTEKLNPLGGNINHYCCIWGFWTKQKRCLQTTFFERHKKQKFSVRTGTKLAVNMLISLHSILHLMGVLLARKCRYHIQNKKAVCEVRIHMCAYIVGEHFVFWAAVIRAKLL